MSCPEKCLRGRVAILGLRSAGNWVKGQSRARTADGPEASPTCCRDPQKSLFPITVRFTPGAESYSPDKAVSHLSSPGRGCPSKVSYSEPPARHLLLGPVPLGHREWGRGPDSKVSSEKPRERPTSLASLAEAKSLTLSLSPGPEPPAFLARPLLSCILSSCFSSLCSCCLLTPLLSQDWICCSLCLLFPRGSRPSNRSHRE